MINQLLKPALPRSCWGIILTLVATASYASDATKITCPTTFTLSEARTIANKGLVKDGITLRALNPKDFKKQLPINIQIVSRITFNPKLEGQGQDNGKTMCRYSYKTAIRNSYVLEIVAESKNSASNTAATNTPTTTKVSTK